jgi:hypothetical protein
MAEMRILKGSCACGRVTFEARGEPKRVGLCHCMTCRKISGSAFNAFVIYPADRVTVSGEVSRWSATPESERGFCPVCGSPVFDRDAADEIELTLGTFDAPNLFTPTYEGWAVRREHWVKTPDLISYPGNRGERTS